MEVAGAGLPGRVLTGRPLPRRADGAAAVPHLVRGWLLDAYAVREGMAVWLIADDGRRIRAVEAWRPTAYFRCPRSDAEAVQRWFLEQGVPADLRVARKTEIMDGRPCDTWALALGDAERSMTLFGGAMRRFTGLTWYNADLVPDRYWFWETGRHPLARVEAETAGASLVSLRVLDSIWDVPYELPPLVTLGLRLEGPARNPAHDRRGSFARRLEVHLNGRVSLWEPDDPGEVPRRLARLIADADPDLIVTEHGDAWLLPELDRMAQAHAVAIPWNRDAERPPRRTKSRSYFSYGAIIHRDAAWHLYGRLHLDQRNSFALGTSGLTGLYETARLGRLPLQTAARTSVGTAISSMQVARAMADGILIPVDKRETEDFKTGEELLQTDRGGLIFQPDLGLFEGVGELDFASMYPTIMVKHNLSQETMNCACCAGDPAARVPGTALWSCRTRAGLIPRTLAPLLRKRAACRRLKKEAATPEERERAAALTTAHKWMLVCCFGYLGYKNARFGRIEAHEATNAWGREAILRAKETAEDAGYRMLHAIVDSLWVKPLDGSAATAAGCLELTAAIEARTGLPVAVEGVYKWIAFLPSRADPRRPVSQRYVGAFLDGGTKARGVEYRRVDAPPFVAALQQEMIAELAKADGAAAARGIAAGLVDRVREVVGDVRAGRMTMAELTIRRHLSKEPAAYRVATPLAVAAGQLGARGAKLEAGEMVAYVLGEGRAWAAQVFPEGEPYDAAVYEKETLRAAATVLEPFGWPLNRLREALGGAPPPRGPVKAPRDAERTLLMPFM